MRSLSAYFLCGTVYYTVQDGSMQPFQSVPETLVHDQNEAVAQYFHVVVVMLFKVFSLLSL